MGDKPQLSADELASKAGGLKKAETQVKNTLPTKEDIAAEKAAS